jgi:DNA-binding HxlR family transcriptional regulator
VRNFERAKSASIIDLDERKESINQTCPAVAAIRSIVSESKFLLVRHLFHGPMRFNKLLRYSGINSKTLSATLKSLEREGIVIRQVISTRPFIVEYSLSPTGLPLGPVFEAMGEWGRKWLPQSQWKTNEELD